MIVVDQVSRSYGEIKAVQNISFEVHPGEVVGLLGPNGAGKTTTLRMLATLLQPDSGHITVSGYDVVSEPLKVRGVLGYETGDTGLYKRLRPIEFLRYFGRLHGIEKETLERRIGQLTEDFEIVSFAQQLCGNLSTGQQQRVSLARALLNDPPVLVLDEPTRGLDIVSAGFVLDELKRAAANGRAVLFSTHIMSEVELTCDRVVVLHRGRILADATVADLLERTGQSQLSRAFLGLIQATEAHGSIPTPTEADAIVRRGDLVTFSEDDALIRRDDLATPKEDEAIEVRDLLGISNGDHRIRLVKRAELETPMDTEAIDGEHGDDEPNHAEPADSKQDGTERGDH